MTLINIGFIAILCLIVRVFLSILPSFEVDQSAFRFWSGRLADFGPSNFYSTSVFTNNPLGILYHFWIVGIINNFFFLGELPKIFLDILLKLPANIADILTGILIYIVLIKNNIKRFWAIIAFLSYVLNPVIFFDSAVWGQYDGVSTLFILLSLYFIVLKKQPVISSVFFAIAWAFKPQVIAYLPIFALLQIIFYKPKIWLFSGLVFFIAILLFYTPFFPNNPFLGIFNVNFGSAELFNCSTCNAYNFWGIFGNWQNDLNTFLGLPFLVWGLILLSISYLFIFFSKPFLKRFETPYIYLTLSVSIMAFFIFLTRMHERYFFPFFALFLMSAFILKSKPLFIFYFIFSVLGFLNLYFPYVYYNQFDNLPFAGYFIETTKGFSFLMFLAFIALLFYYLKLMNNKFFSLNFSILKKLDSKKILILILVFAFFIRVLFIWYPKDYVFDEVYHGFTAREYLKGSKEAWEWWTKPPPYVAYEWTHPPMAKEIMTGSMFILRTTDPWAYRLPGALLGVISVYLVYLIAQKLFNKDPVSLLSAFIFSIDGLNFVQSRTGMNDIYFVAFMLASLALFLNKKLFFSSIFVGLALASKWTGLYLIVFMLLLSIIKKEYFKSLYFIFAPPVIYLLSYVPFFLLSHDIKTFIELQKQMWWYHTNLKAHHDYESPWWSWPLNLYPVWYFVDYINNKTANIFASGNPAVFWLGTIAVILSIKDALFSLFKKNFSLFVKLSIILLGFFVFWLPWAFSPRIMFLYHFAPSVPFLSIALGYQLGKFWDQEKYEHSSSSNKYPVLIILLYLLLGFLFVYPFLVGIGIPRDWVSIFFRTNLTKNPFGP